MCYVRVQCAHWRNLADTIEPSMLGNPAKMAEPIEMPFWIWAQVGPRNHVLDGGPDRPMPMGSLLWKGHAWACPTTLCHDLCKNG